MKYFIFFSGFVLGCNWVDILTLLDQKLKGFMKILDASFAPHGMDDWE